MQVKICAYSLCIISVCMCGAFNFQQSNEMRSEHLHIPTFCIKACTKREHLPTFVCTCNGVKCVG